MKECFSSDVFNNGHDHEGEAVHQIMCTISFDCAAKLRKF